MLRSIQERTGKSTSHGIAGCPRRSVTFKIIKPCLVRTTSEMVDEFGDAIVEKACHKLILMMTEDVVLLRDSESPTIGREAVATLCIKLFKRFDIRKQIEFGVGRVVQNAVDIPGGYLLTIIPVDGMTSKRRRGQFVAILIRDDGGWKLHGCFSWGWPAGS